MSGLNEFEKKCQAWLDASPAERNLEAGAMLMLQANKNRILYQNVINKSNFPKIEYEIVKFLNSRNVQINVAKQNFEENISKTEIDAYNVITSIDQIEKKGKRSDHNALPDDVKAISETNTVLYHEMRSIHEKLKVFNGENYSAKDRLPLLNKMIELRDKIALNWAEYDSFDPSKPKAPEKEIKPIDFQRINSNRVYIGRAIKEVSVKIEAGKLEAANIQISEAQNRYNELMAAGQEVKAETIAGLKAIGVIVN